MKTVKGFVTINAYVTNIPSQVALLGELSTWSRTYSKEKGEYVNSSTPGYKLTTFKVFDNVTKQLDVLLETQVSQILQVVKTCVDYASTHIRPYDPIDFKNNLLAEFHTKIANLQIGDFVDNGSIALPQWVSWDNLLENNNSIKIWLSDQAFQNQYDEYSIEVITPIEPIDNFFGAYNSVLAQLRTRTTAQLGDIIQAKKGNNPETFVRILNFDFYNVLNVEQKNSTDWAVLIYGKQGDNIDSIKDAIVEHVLKNSTKHKLDWETVLPGLFKRTEFVLFPRWDKVSIPNLTENSSLYSSLLSPKDCINFVKAAIDFYPDAHIENNVNIFPFDYKGVLVVAVNGDTNINEFLDLKEIYPDYLPVPTTSPDFSRMNIKTRDWILLVQRLLMSAEVTTEFSSVPSNMRKQTKGGLLFVSTMYDNVNYLVATKSNRIFD